MKYILSLIIGGALVVSGFGQTRNVLVNTNNVVVQPTNFWSADASNARAGLGLGSVVTNSSTAFQPSSLVLSNLASSNGVNLTNIPLSGVVGALATNGNAVNLTNFPANLLRTNGSAFGLTNFPANLLTTNGNGAGLTNLTAANITGSVVIASGGTGATNAATARTNLGLGWSALTNTNSTNFRNAIGLGVTNVVRFEGIQLYQDAEVSNSITYTTDTLDFNQSGSVFLSLDSTTDGTVIAYRDIAFGGTNSSLNAAQTRTNFGLPWSGLTNTNAATFQTALFGSNTNPVLVNTNGDVVSPTNFWQQAPIATTVAFSAPTTNSTNTATNSRNLIIQSLSSNINNTTNTLLLPTNTSTFNGDTAVVIHAGGSGSATAILQAGQTSNLIVLTNFDHAVRFIYFNNAWDFYHNVAYVEPIYFSGTNAEANAAASRTNLGLGATNLVRFGGGTESNVGVGVGSTNTGLASGGTLSGRLGLIKDGNIIAVLSQNDPFFGLYYPLTFQGASATSNAATTRTNLGIPLAALTNNNVTNFRTAIGLGATNDVSFSVVNTSMGLRVTNGTNTVVYIGEDTVELETSLHIGNTLGISFSTNNSAAATTRTNLGIPLSALTNTNNANFQAAVFATNAAPTNSANVNTVNFNTAVHWMEIIVKTNGTNATFRIPLFQ